MNTVRRCSFLFPGRDDDPVARQEPFEILVFYALDETEKFAPVDEPMLEQFVDELEVLFTTCCQLAERKVMFFKAQADRPLLIIDLQLDQALLPTVGECGGFRRDAMGVITIFVVKGR